MMLLRASQRDLTRLISVNLCLLAVRISLYEAYWPGPSEGSSQWSFQAYIIYPVSDAEKQERAAWLSEADVEFFTGGGPSGQPSGLVHRAIASRKEFQPPSHGAGERDHGGGRRT